MDPLMPPTHRFVSRLGDPIFLPNEEAPGDSPGASSFQSKSGEVGLRFLIQIIFRSLTLNILLHFRPI